MKDCVRSTYNQLANATNEFQGEYRKVLFLCSAGLLRSATAAHVYSAEPYNFNTRTAGVTRSYALNLVSEVLMEWADTVVLMDDEVYEELKFLFEMNDESYAFMWGKKTVRLNVPDEFRYRQPELISLLREQLDSRL